MDAPTTTKLRSASNATLLALSRRPVLFVLAFLLVAGYTANITQLSPTLRFRTSSDEESAPAPTQPTLSEDERRHKRMCYNERDYGMIKYLKQAPQAFCTNSTGVDPALGPLSTFTRYYTGGSDLRATVLTNTWIDLRNAQVFKPIQNISQDGHLHDPRFKYPSVDIYCTCNSNQDSLTVTDHSMPRAWDWMLAEHPDPKKYWKVCTAFDDANAMAQLASGMQDGSSVPSYKVHHVKTNAILLGRRDDHNPFFQISLALNAWTIMQVLDWKPETTQLVYLDDGLPSPIDDLQRQVLSPVHPVVNGRDILGSVLRFDQAMIAPFEYSGPMMRHLDDDEPCRQTRLIQDFRDLVMSKFSVVQQKRKPESCTITIITRRPYHGRMVQRKWLNEDAIVDRMQDDYVRTPGFYKYGTCKIQSVEFVDLSLADQMKVVVESDVIIGMHGAGMVNVLWARPETVVVEIFPKHRHRWGYRNLCQFVGCQWHQFRGGKEIGKGKGDNTSDKMISYADWFAFFDPIVRNAVSALEERVANNKR